MNCKMMWVPSIVFVFIICVMSILIVPSSLAAGQTNYSGEYSLKASNGSDVDSSATLHIIQDERMIQITHQQSGRVETTQFPLNGEEADYMSPSGIAGKRKSKFKGSDLILESVLDASRQKGHEYRMRTKQHLQLSADSNVLTIRTDVDCPDLPSLRIVNGSRTEVYLRNAKP